MNKGQLIALGTMAETDSDGYWLVDATAEMALRSTTIVSIATPAVERRDGSPMTGADLTVAGINVVVGGLQWTFRAQGRGNVGRYLVSFPLTLANNDLITRTGEIFVKPIV